MNREERKDDQKKENGRKEPQRSDKNDNRRGWEIRKLLGPTLVTILGMECRFTERRIKYARGIRAYQEAEREVERLFNEAYRLHKEGKPQEELEPVLRQIIAAGGEFFFAD